MIEHFELKSYTYEQSRLMFFREKRQNAKRRLQYWKNRAINGSYNSLQAVKASEAADEFCFYNDVVVMLGGESIDG